MAEITPEQYQARTEAINTQTAAILESIGALVGGLSAPVPERRPTDEELWERYFRARAESVFCDQPAKARDWANAALAEHRKKFPA